MTYSFHGLGATGSSDAATKIAAFASTARAEAERCFAATTFRMDADAARRDDVIVTTAQASTAAKAALATDPAKAKSIIDTAMAKAASVLPQIKDIADVAKVQAAANAAKAAIDAAAAAARAAASAPRPTSTAPAAPVQPLAPATSGGFSLPSIPPVGIVALVIAAALFLIPSRKRSNPSNIVKTRSDEKLWRRAKAAARRQGRSDYRYIVGTFKRMQANKALSDL
jgi:hypothetical protein